MMGKRSNPVVILSSDDDDENEDSNEDFVSSNSKSLSKSNSTTSSSRRCSSTTRSSRKKTRLSDSLSSSVHLFSAFDELKFYTQDFSEDFAGFKVSTGTKTPGASESWVDKYRPRSLDELCVHKKKVEEVKTWFEEKLADSKKGLGNYVLLLSGQAGTGKSATVRVIASHFRAEVCEWNTPTPTIWQEHVHNLNSGMRYMSKLDEFENFVDRVRKYGMLYSSVSGSKLPLVLFIEDLPATNGKMAQGRLLRCLQLLVRSVQIPTVILITDYGGGDSADVSIRYWEELSSLLESAGACKVSFNPITVNSIKKVLSRICREEQCHTTSEHIDTIANASGGDIRHAIMSLHYFCLKQEKRVLVSSNKRASSSEAKAPDPGQKDGGFSLPLGRDLTLSLFHALDENAFYLKEGFTRLPLKMDAPEKVLCQAYGQARPVAEFLHENVLDFIGPEAIDDAWAVASYLSDADCLLSSIHRTFARNYEAENVVQSAAASVAVRGVLFGNAHPSPSRWHAIRRPMLWQVEQLVRRNMDVMESQRSDHYNGLNLTNRSAVCIEHRPALKWLGYRASSHSKNLVVDNSLVQGDEIYSLEQESESTDDEIEDW